MLVPNRNYSSPEYRYGFQGQEKDDEIKGNGNSVNYKYRMHDPRVGRFLSLDPLFSSYPHNSPYAFSENRVIDGFELEGLEHNSYLVKFNKEGTFTTITTAHNNNWFTRLYPTTHYEVHMANGDVNGYSFTPFGGIDQNSSFNNNSNLTEFARDPKAAIKSGKFRTDNGVLYKHAFDIVLTATAAKALTKTKVKVKTENSTTTANKTVNKKSVIETATVTRVQTEHKLSKRISVDKSNNVEIEGNTTLYITIDDANHVKYYYNKKGGSEKGASIVSFKIDKKLADEIRKSAVPQAQAKSFPNKPEISDPTKAKGAFGIKGEYLDKLKKAAIKGSGKVENP